MFSRIFRDKPLVLFVTFAALGLGAPFAACSSSTDREVSGFGPDGGKDKEDGQVTTVVEDDSGVSESGCSEAAKLVYVVSRQKQLYSFDPASLKFKSIGLLDCDAGPMTPNSMAIDRQAIAWVSYEDGSLFKVDTKDASCTSTTFKTGQHGFGRMGMGFSTNGTDSKDETLYVVGIDNASTTVKGQGLGKIDLQTLKLDVIGDFTDGLKGTAPELTGTGDGRLFGFFTTTPARVGEISKTNAATPNSDVLTGVKTGAAWAFSFWGGDFWFYTAEASTNPLDPFPKSSKVTQLKASGDGSLAVVVPDVGFTIVGAGVSTCAPVGPIL